MLSEPARARPVRNPWSWRKQRTHRLPAEASLLQALNGDLPGKARAAWRSAALRIVKAAIAEANTNGPEAGALLGLVPLAWKRVLAQTRELGDPKRLPLRRIAPPLKALLDGPFEELRALAAAEVRAVLTVWPHSKPELWTAMLGEDCRYAKRHVPDLRWEVNRSTYAREHGCTCVVCEAWRTIWEHTPTDVPNIKQIRRFRALSAL